MKLSELIVVAQRSLVECGDVLVGCEDQDGSVCSVQVASVVSDHMYGFQYFLIRADGGSPLLSESEDGACPSD